MDGRGAAAESLNRAANNALTRKRLLKLARAFRKLSVNAAVQRASEQHAAMMQRSKVARRQEEERHGVLLRHIAMQLSKVTAQSKDEQREGKNGKEQEKRKEATPVEDGGAAASPEARQTVDDTAKSLPSRSLQTLQLKLLELQRENAGLTRCLKDLLNPETEAKVQGQAKGYGEKQREKTGGQLSSSISKQRERGKSK